MGRAYEGDPTRLPAESFGLTPVVPPKRNRTAPWDYDREAYKGVLLQCLLGGFGSVFPQCGLMVFPGAVIVSR